jgi:predicted metalloprotease with PDZ domain
MLDDVHEHQEAVSAASTSVPVRKVKASRLPQPLPRPEPIIEPRDIDYPGVMRLNVDARDVERRIFSARQIIPVHQSGQLTLLYPKWLPGYHAPVAPIELFAGLEISCSGNALEWRRHETEVNAFHVEVPEGATELEASFQFLSPTNSSQGRVLASREMLNLEWNTLVLYPAGHFARRILVQPSVTIPEGWHAACALTVASKEGSTLHFETAQLDVLVDSPLFAGRHFRRIALDEAGEVHLNLFGDSPELIDAAPDQIEPHRELVRQADRLFGTRPYDRFEILLGLSDEIGSIGVEHHRSCEAVSLPGYFTEWDKTVARRTTIPHEYIHSWNGKYRRGADSWSPCFHEPIRNSLMWVYEGQTQYWDRVLCARSGLWSRELALQAIADTAATHQLREGSVWRPLSDTTRDPIVASRSPLPWPSWQRSEDYYTEGSLIWLDVDTRIRELSGETRSLDDFARAFFGQEDRVWVTSTYRFADVTEALEKLAPWDWKAFFDEKLNTTTAGAPLDGLARGGYRLVYRDEQSEYQRSMDAVSGNTNLLYSLGLMVRTGGSLTEVRWGSPAFEGGLTSGGQIEAVNDRPFSAAELARAVAERRGVELMVKDGSSTRSVTINYAGGHRYPHLEPLAGARRRLDEILVPLGE